MSPWVRSVWAVALLVMAGGTRARAAVTQGGWELDLYAGEYNPGPSELDSDLKLGIRFGRNVTERFNIFVDIGRSDVVGSVASPRPLAPVELGGDLQIYSFNLGGNFTPQKRWVTMLYGGVGWTVTEINAVVTSVPVLNYIRGLEDNIRTMNVGVAGKLQVSRLMFVRLDVGVRYNFGRSAGEFDTEYTGGIGWTFGQ